MKELFDAADLVEKVLNKKDGATHEFVLKTQKDLFQFCFHLAKNRQLAEDITHDTYLKAFSSLDQLKNPQVLLAWLKSIARFLFLDFIKSSAQSKKHISLDDIEAESDAAFSVAAGCNADQMTAMQILQLLSEEDRTILILIDIQENSYQDVAVALKIAEGTVKSRLSRARDKFAHLYNNGTNDQAKSSKLK